MPKALNTEPERLEHYYGRLYVRSVLHRNNELNHVKYVLCELITIYFEIFRSNS